MDYVEFDGPNSKNLLSDYMWDNYPLFCYADDSYCDFEILTVQSLNNSNSVNTNRADQTRLDIYVKLRGGTSLKNMIHMGQLINSGKFQKFDFGKEQNLFEYFQEDPPEIKIENIEIPIAMYIAEQDYIADL
jgi:hypothetical protein